MRIYFVTIAYNAMPFITAHWPTFRQLPSSIDWTWDISEGVSAPMGCTYWVNDLPPSLSTDGTKEYLDDIAALDSRVRLHRNPKWSGKNHQINAGLGSFKDPGLLWQVDADELWSARVITEVADYMAADTAHKISGLRFYCRYFVGPRLILKGGNYGNCEDEWRRVWRFIPGKFFERHEPPHYNEGPPRMGREETLARGWTFDHYSWATEAQVAFKSKFYASDVNPWKSEYENAVENWKHLQAHTEFPVRADQFLPWMVGAMVEKI